MYFSAFMLLQNLMLLKFCIDSLDEYIFTLQFQSEDRGIC